MQTAKVLIATAILFIFSTVLMGCRSAENTGVSGFRSAAPKKDVTMEFAAERAASEVKVKISLKNPSRRPISSVQAWLGYNPETLKGIRIDVADSPFILTAPLENDFDAEKGLAKVGRANNRPITDPNITVATLYFKTLKDGASMVNAYDYQGDLSGHFSANVLVGKRPYNVLLKPVNPVLILQ